MASISPASSNPVVTSAPTTKTRLRRGSLIPVRWADDVRALGPGSATERRPAALSLAQAFATDHLAMYLVETEGSSSLSSYPVATDENAAAAKKLRFKIRGTGSSSGGSVNENADNCQTEEVRWRAHVDIFRYLVAAHCLAGIVTTIGPDYESVALWTGPGQYLESWATTLRSGMWRLRWRLSAEGHRRLHRELLPLLDRTRADVLGSRAGDDYYLVYLGTKPSGRGRGYAGKLISHMAARADRESRPMYLEASSQANCTYYRKFGFADVKDIWLGGDGGGPQPASSSSSSVSPQRDDGAGPVCLTIMVREPQTPATPPPAAVGVGLSTPTAVGAKPVGGGGKGSGRRRLTAHAHSLVPIRLSRAFKGL